ncbi:hypothetical protein NSP_7620 [Nodularia spumigena CCY9414]|nr:hypothetical protein NSP_7620 [Nodularia spumigena CCY9414]
MIALPLLVHPIAGLYCLPVYFRPSLSTRPRLFLWQYVTTAYN